MTTNPTTRPRIVVLDGFTLNPGDLDWSGLQTLGEFTVHDRTPPHEVMPRANGAQIVLTNKTVLDAAVIAALPRLRYIGVLATGYNVVDIAAAAARGIPVTNTPGYGTPAVAQHTFALLLELCHHVGHHAATTREGRWCDSPDFCYWDFPLTELAGLTLGVVGYGAIGRAVARIGRAFGMNIIAHTEPPCAPEDGVEFVPLDDVFRRADVVTLHCPLTEATRNLVNARRLALMKPTAFLINTSRGPLVAEQDLADALNAGRIAGAGLDVLAVEPPGRTNPLFAAKNCLITPHIAWATRAARQRLMDIAVANVRAFLAGQPQNVVNGV
ncbi:MAG: D-2-hydroxyacid dehydrogenase [Verrucomicrobia bacterium]|nr:D-2-hydroxyacid dehydrogenase [Verrucomicrobiota bacterium]